MQRKAQEKRLSVIVKYMVDFLTIQLNSLRQLQALKIPASLACYWLGESETLPE